MVITTNNSAYTFEDNGDGAFIMRSTNEKYPGPSLIRFHDIPRVGSPFYAQFLDGDRKGRTLISSKVTSIELPPLW
jgi:hypothetical protein